MKKILLAHFFVCSAAHAEESKFALICEWTNGQTGNSLTFHVDLVKATVNNHKAKITDSTIYFIQDATEYTIDRVSGVLKANDLKPVGIRLAGPIIRCKKVPEVKQF